jgi:hypothetical protein
MGGEMSKEKGKAKRKDTEKKIPDDLGARLVQLLQKEKEAQGKPERWIMVDTTFKMENSEGDVIEVSYSHEPDKTIDSYISTNVNGESTVITLSPKGLKEFSEIVKEMGLS